MGLVSLSDKEEISLLEYAQRKGHARTRGEGCYLQTKEDISLETNPAGTLISDF